MPVPPDQAREVNYALARAMRALQNAARSAPAVREGLDGSSQALLFRLLEQPHRISALAELTHSDISVVSRRVSNLVRHGLAVKEVDERDRRAQRVELTDSGQASVLAAIESRAVWMSEILHDWNPEDAAAFSRALHRMADDLTQATSPPLAEAAPEPVPAEPVPAEPVPGEPTPTETAPAVDPTPAVTADR